jgi:hypothetical protein
MQTAIATRCVNPTDLMGYPNDAGQLFHSHGSFISRLKNQFIALI